MENRLNKHCDTSLLSSVPAYWYNYTVNPMTRIIMPNEGCVIATPIIRNIIALTIRVPFSEEMLDEREKRPGATACMKCKLFSGLSCNEFGLNCSKLWASECYLIILHVT